MEGGEEERGNDVQSKAMHEVDAIKAREAYYGGKRDLLSRQKRPTMEAKEAYQRPTIEAKKAYERQKRPTVEAKEAYYRGKRGLLMRRSYE